VEPVGVVEVAAVGSHEEESRHVLHGDVALLHVTLDEGDEFGWCGECASAGV